MSDGVPSAVRVYMQEFGLTMEEAYLYWHTFVEKGILPNIILKQIEENRKSRIVG